MFEAIYTKNEAERTLTVERQFAASKDKVWHAWTTDTMLEKWWGPEPWKAVTKSFSFTNGGKWHYAMTGPDGEKHWAMLEYETINPEDSYVAWDAFANEEGNKNTTLPVTKFKTEFTEKDGRTKVTTTMFFKDIASMNQLMEMGMAEGMAIGYRQLDELLK